MLSSSTRSSSTSKNYLPSVAADHSYHQAVNYKSTSIDASSSKLSRLRSKVHSKRANLKQDIQNFGLNYFMISRDVRHSARSNSFGDSNGICDPINSLNSNPGNTIIGSKTGFKSYVKQSSYQDSKHGFRKLFTSGGYKSKKENLILSKDKPIRNEIKNTETPILYSSNPLSTLPYKPAVENMDQSSSIYSELSSLSNSPNSNIDRPKLSARITHGFKTKLSKFQQKSKEFENNDYFVDELDIPILSFKENLIRKFRRSHASLSSNNSFHVSSINSIYETDQTSVLSKDFDKDFEGTFSIHESEVKTQSGVLDTKATVVTLPGTNSYNTVEVGKLSIDYESSTSTVVEPVVKIHIPETPVVTSSGSNISKAEGTVNGANIQSGTSVIERDPETPVSVLPGSNISNTVEVRKLSIDYESSTSTVVEPGVKIHIPETPFVTLPGPCISNAVETGELSIDYESNSPTVKGDELLCEIMELGIHEIAIEEEAFDNEKSYEIKKSNLLELSDLTFETHVQEVDWDKYSSKNEAHFFKSCETYISILQRCAKREDKIIKKQVRECKDIQNKVLLQIQSLKDVRELQQLVNQARLLEDMINLRNMAFSRLSENEKVERTEKVLQFHSQLSSKLVRGEYLLSHLSSIGAIEIYNIGIDLSDFKLMVVPLTMLSPSL